MMMYPIGSHQSLYHDIPADDISCHENITDEAAKTTSRVVRILWDFVAPVLFCVGIIGNVLILVVMSRKPLRGTSTSAYLMIMAVADLLVLVTGMIPEWLEANGMVTVKELHPFTCKLEKFLFYTSSDTAIWIRVLFTLDRFMAVCFPMSKTDCCLSWRAKYYSLAALGAAVVKNVHVFLTRGAEFRDANSINTDCVWMFESNSTSSEAANGTGNHQIVVLISNCGSPSPEFKYFETFIRPWIAFSLVSVLPFCVILLCNLLIIRSLIQVKRTRAEHLLVTVSHDRNIFQMTAMCLSASFCFLVCVTPSIILLIGKPYWTGFPNPAYDIAKAINNQLYYANHSANFFLYCITGKRFRTTLTQLCRPCCAGRYDDLTGAIRTSAFSASLMSSRSTSLQTPSVPSPSSQQYKLVGSPITELKEFDEKI